MWFQIASWPLCGRGRHAGGSALHAVAVGDQLGAAGVGAGSVVQALRQGCAAAGGEDPQVVVRVGLQQGLGARRQQRLVGGHVAAVEDQARTIGGERVEVMHAGPVAGRRLGDAAGPGRDAAIGVAGPLRPSGVRSWSRRAAWTSSTLACAAQAQPAPSNRMPSFFNTAVSFAAGRAVPLLLLIRPKPGNVQLEGEVRRVCPVCLEFRRRFSARGTSLVRWVSRRART